MARYFLLNKPYGVLSQFTREHPRHRTLADVYDFPPNVYPVGRLDRDSEGLLILTDDGRLNSRLLDPAHEHRRTYWARVEGCVPQQALDKLRQGPTIRINKRSHRSAPIHARVIHPDVPPRTPPVRYRKTVADTWLQLVLTEGKNRQVRRACAAVGHPVLRLLRYAIEEVTLEDVADGPVREVTADWLLVRLKL